MHKRLLTATALLLTAAAGAQSTVTHTHTVTRTSASGSGSAYSQLGNDDAPQTRDELFAGTSIFEKNATSVTDIDMGPESLGMVGGKQASDAHHMVLNSVKTYEYDQPGLFNLADVDKFRQKLNTGDWHCSIHERNLKTGESTDVCSKARTDGYREEAIITVEKKELTFIHRITRAGYGGHSELGQLPLIELDHLAPAMAMILPGEIAGLQAEMKARTAGLQAEMKAFTTTKMRGLIDIQRDLGRIDLQSIQPLDPMQFDQLRQKFFVVPDPPALLPPPPPPAKPLE